MKSKQKTKMVLMKAWKSFSNILPQLLGIMMIVGFSLSFLSAQQISRLVGESSGKILEKDFHAFINTIFVFCLDFINETIKHAILKK
jgi:hypothetical protein